MSISSSVHGRVSGRQHKCVVRVLILAAAAVYLCVHIRCAALFVRSGGAYHLPPSASLFCLTLCVFCLHSIGYRIVASLASGVCPLVDVAGGEASSGFLVGVASASVLVDG